MLGASSCLWVFPLFVLLGLVGWGAGDVISSWALARYYRGIGMVTEARTLSSGLTVVPVLTSCRARPGCVPGWCRLPSF